MQPLAVRREVHDLTVNEQRCRVSSQVGLWQFPLGPRLLALRRPEHLSGREIDADTLIDAQVEGYARASLVAGLILAGAAVLVVLMVNVRRLVVDPAFAVPGPVAEPMLVPPPPRAFVPDRNTDTMPVFLPTGDAGRLG